MSSSTNLLHLAHAANERWFVDQALQLRQLVKALRPFFTQMLNIEKTAVVEGKARLWSEVHESNKSHTNISKKHDGAAKKMFLHDIRV